MSRPSWEREAEFRALLQRCASKASREGLETLADIAVRDDRVRWAGRDLGGVARAGGRVGCSRCLLLARLRRGRAARVHALPPQVAYKAVCGLIVHEMKHCKPGGRLRLLYALSAILRASKARRGERDKYGERACCSDWLQCHPLRQRRRAQR